MMVGEISEAERPAGQAAYAVVLAGGYFLAAMLSWKLFYSGSAAAGLWAANAFAVGVILRAPFSSLWLPAILVAGSALASNLFAGIPLRDALLFTSASFTSIFLGVGLVQNRFVTGGKAIQGARSYMLTVLLAGLLAPAIAGAIYAMIRMQMTGDPIYATWWLWISGDALGFATVLPLTLLASRTAVMDFFRPKHIAQLVVAVACVFAAAFAGSAWTNFPFIILLVPLLISAAYLPRFMVALTCTIAVLVMLGGISSGITPPPALVEAMNAYRFQISLAICAVLPLLGGMMLDQMRLDRKVIAASENRFRRAMKDSPIGVVIVALDGTIIETNPAFAEMLGYTCEEMVARKFSDITDPQDLSVGHSAMEKVRDGTSQTYGFEKRYLHRNGHPIWTKVAGSVIRDEDTDKPLYLVSQIENIDARKKSEAAVAAAETRWNFALASAGQGVWDMDFTSGQVTYSSTWKKMLGYEENELDGDPNMWLNLIHPDDRASVEQADKDHLAGKTPMFEAEFRMRHKDGRWVWILDRGQVVERNSDGGLVRAIGTMTDITMRREAEEALTMYAAALADEKERLKITLASIGDAVICTDAENRITFMNPVAEKLTHMSAETALGRSLFDVYRSVDEDTGERLMPNATDRLRLSNRAVLIRSDGSVCSIREVVSQIVTDRGDFGGSVIVFQDFTDARTLQRELAYAAAHDALTGLANRASFMRAMETTIMDLDNAGDGTNAGHMLFIDLDNFKPVNDTGGHAAGDALLKRVADTIQAMVRPGDVVGRLGGDEFAAVLKFCTVREAEAIANKMIGAIGAIDFNWNGRRYGVGASIGVATFDGHAREPGAIIARADEACYAAKSAGRNCVVVAAPGLPLETPQKPRQKAAFAS